jgi:tRNA pseudouridine38-40 synthase
MQSMSHWKLILAYDGTPFHGWQIQPGLPTIQGLLADAIYRTVGERVLPQGSGRTDAGVHALAQVASFSLNAPIPAANLHRALNRRLPPSIRILSAETAPTAFHARHSALRKTYEYRIFPLCPIPESGPSFPPSTAPGRQPSFWPTDRISVVATHSPGNLHPEASNLQLHPSVDDAICPPTLAPFVWPCPWRLDLAALNQAATHILGTHDFTTFAAADPDLATRTPTEPSARFIAPLLHATSGTTAVESPARSPIRTISHSHWYVGEGLLIYRATANGFLHHMVRNLVGTFVQAGAHRIDPDSIPTLVAARNRAAAGPTAPPTGLFLVSVEYPPNDNPQPVACNSV